MVARYKKALIGVALGAMIGVASFAPGLAYRSNPHTGAIRQAFAQPGPAQGAAPDVVVARVGDATITARELERRMGEMPQNVLATMGSTPQEVMVPAALFAEEAKAKGLEKQREVRDRMLSVLRSALVRDLKQGLNADAVDDDDVKSFYQGNPDKFSAPKRIGIYRILVSSEAEASALVKEVGSVPDPKAWNDLARDKSLDKASRLRGGNLGLVAEDGVTGQAGDKVDPALFAAADPVKEGELVPRPVKEGDKWAVVWKRQETRPSVRSFQQEAPGIKANLEDERLRKAMQDLLSGLRSELVGELNPELCDMVSVTASGELERTKRPGVLPRSKRGAAPVPTDGPGGLR